MGGAMSALGGGGLGADAGAAAEVSGRLKCQLSRVMMAN